MELYDFGGYVTKYNILCTDGRTIMPEAFKDCDGKAVPLTASRDDFLTLDNVLGRVLLENRDDGVYGYGVFNDSQRAKMYQRMVEDNSIEGLGIYANQLKESDKCVTYAVIQSVMLCMYPANPHAKIDIINKKEQKMHNYTEFDKLVKMLDDTKIPYERDDDDPNLEYYKRTGNKPVKRIKYGRFPGEKIGCICSVICGHGTYGGDKGLLEIMGLLTPGEEEQGDVVGWLSAEDVFNRIKKHWEDTNGREEM